MATDSSVSLTTGEENTVNIVEGESMYLLDREGHPRYLRLWRALFYLKEALHEPVRLEANKLHSKLKKKIPEEKKNLNEKIGRLADQLGNYLNKSHESNKIYIKNINKENWENQPWETGKAFMPSGQMESNKGPKDTDTMGILRLISGCMQFDPWLKVDEDGVSGDEKVQKALEVRNSLGHSNSLCCTEMEMEEGVKQIKILMEHLKRTFKGFADADIVSEEDKKIYQEAAKKMEDALDCVDKVMSDRDFDVMRRFAVEDICRSRAFESLDEIQRKEIAKVQFRYETRNIVSVFYDLHKGLSKEFKNQLLGQEILASYIFEANSDVMFHLVALEEKGMFQAEKLDDLLRLIEPIHKEDEFRTIKQSVMECKIVLKRTSDIASAIVYDVIILHCEDDRVEANNFKKDWLDSLKELNPPAKTILYDEYVVPGTSAISALENVLEDCRFVFILCTQVFVNDNLSKFQAEMVMYNNLQKKEDRVIPVHLSEEDLKRSPSWIKTLTPIQAWKLHTQTPLMKKLKDGRKKYLKS